jgi:hypothetical protein
LPLTLPSSRVGSPDAYVAGAATVFASVGGAAGRVRPRLHLC